MAEQRNSTSTFAFPFLCFYIWMIKLVYIYIYITIFEIDAAVFCYVSADVHGLRTAKKGN